MGCRGKRSAKAENSKRTRRVCERNNLASSLGRTWPPPAAGSQCISEPSCQKDDASILECAHSSITLGLLDDGLADLWALKRRPRPSHCHSPAASSESAQREQSVKHHRTASEVEETWDSSDATDILIARNFKWLGMTAARINNYDCLSFPHVCLFRF